VLALKRDVPVPQGGGLVVRGAVRDRALQCAADGGGGRAGGLQVGDVVLPKGDAAGHRGRAALEDLRVEWGGGGVSVGGCGATGGWRLTVRCAWRSQLKPQSGKGKGSQYRAQQPKLVAAQPLAVPKSTHLESSQPVSSERICVLLPVAVAQGPLC